MKFAFANDPCQRNGVQAREMLLAGVWANRDYALADTIVRETNHTA